MQIKISVIIPLFNKRSTIQQTIDSVLNQTFDNFELLVIDDGSTDGSGDMVQSYSDNRIRYIKKQNGGVSSARNVGIKEAKGEYLLFLDADDFLKPICLEILTRPIMSNQDVDISAAGFSTLQDGKSECYANYSFEGTIPNNYKWMFLRRYTLRAGSFLIKKELACAHLFDESLSRYEDKKCTLDWIRNASIYYSSSSVMLYNRDSSELSKVSENVSKDFIFNMNFQHITLWERLILGELLFQGLKCYNRYRYKLISQYGLISVIYAFSAKLIRKLL